MGMSRLDGFLPFYICMGLLCVRAPLSLIDNQITHVTKTTQQFGQNEFIAQCENCLTKYWTINKNAKVPKLERRKMESEVIEENTKRL